MPIVTILWAILVKLWAKVQFKGSFEWLITLTMGKLTGKKTERLNTDYILNGYTAYIEYPKEAPAETSRNATLSIQPETLNKETRGK